MNDSPEHPLPHALKIESETAFGATEFAHLFRMPMTFASDAGGAAPETATFLNISNGAVTGAALQPSRGGAAIHSPSIGRG